MRLAARLPHDLWREVVETAYYLRNRTPRGTTQGTDWKSPLELFTKKRASLAHLRPDTKEDQFLPYFDRFSDFYPTPIEDGSHGAFTAGRLFKPQLSARKKDHLASHEEMGSFEEVLKEKARGKQVLGCKKALYGLRRSPLL
ncbi:hypothetical protein HRG_013514 [Hirsutella rhossiliensis]